MVDAPGVLANDSIPTNLSPASAFFIAPFPGDFTNVGGGGFRFGPGTLTGVVQLHYVIRTSNGDSNQATVSVTIEGGAQPSATVRGTVGEYGTPYLNESVPIAGVTIAAVGESIPPVVTDAEGRFEFVASSTPRRLRASKAGYQAQEKDVPGAGGDHRVDFIMVRECSPWPAEVMAMMNRLGLANFGACLARFPSSQSSNYVAAQRTVYYRSPGPNGEISTLGHELCHVYQHKLILETGKSDPRHDGDFVPWWTGDTAQGRSFVESIGWRLPAPGPAPSFGWVIPDDAEKASWGTYPNPIEDHAEVCNGWINAENSPNRGPSRMRQFSPKRAGWAERWIK